MSEPEDKSQQPQQPKPKFSQEQYDMLMLCSKKKDITDWNEWREKNPSVEIWLEGAKLRNAHLEDANLSLAHLENAVLWGAHLKNANLCGAHLERADFNGTDLQGAELIVSNLKGANFLSTNLQGADLRVSIVDGETLICTRRLDRDTDFTGVGLGSVRAEPILKQFLEYNVRRIGWDKWYKDHLLLKLLVWPFWQMSDYGRSTGRVIVAFFTLALIFAGIYYVCGLIWHPGVVANLFEDTQRPIPAWLVPIRAVYFSIVTMTTLGFGDMYANARNLAGHMLLTLQVLLGYVLLGALVTRFAVLFTAGGPAAKFADEKTIWHRLAKVFRRDAK